MNDQFLELTDLAPVVDCAVLVLDETGQIVSSNPMAQSLLDLSAEELIGQRCLPLTDAAPLAEPSCDSDQPLTVMTLEAARKTLVIKGTRVVLDPSIVGRVLTLVLLNHQCNPPVTALFSDEVLNDISHALRTPLCSVVGYLDLLAEQYRSFGRAELGKILSVVQRNAHWAEHLVDNLLAELTLCTGHLQIQPRPTFLAGLLEEAAGIVGMLTAGAQRTLTLVLPDPRTTVWADRDRLLQILVNVLTNAVKRVPEDGHITVTATEGEGYSHIAVSDDSPGIAWWERGYSRVNLGQPATVGAYPAYTGLGLTLAKSVVELHGGSISLSCREGEGSTMKFTLPSAPPEIVSRAVINPLLASMPQGVAVEEMAAVPTPTFGAGELAPAQLLDGMTSPAPEIGSEG